MNDFIVTTACQGRCIHPGSKMTFKSTHKKVLVDRKPVLISMTDQFSDNIDITGCSCFVSSVHHPCVSSKWIRSTNKVLADKNRILIGTISGNCFAADKAFQSQAFVTSIQRKVKGC